MQTKHEVKAKSYKGLANSNKLKPFKIELKRLEVLSESIVQGFAHMRQAVEEVPIFLNIKQNKGTSTMYSRAVQAMLGR